MSVRHDYNRLPAHTKLALLIVGGCIAALVFGALVIGGPLGALIALAVVACVIVACLSGIEAP